MREDDGAEEGTFLERGLAHGSFIYSEITVGKSLGGAATHAETLGSAERFDVQRSRRAGSAPADRRCCRTAARA